MQEEGVGDVEDVEKDDLIRSSTSFRNLDPLLRKKVGQVVLKCTSAIREKEKLETMMASERKRSEEMMDGLRRQNRELTQELVQVKEKFSKTLEVLSLYQTRLSDAMKINEQYIDSMKKSETDRAEAEQKIARLEHQLRVIVMGAAEQRDVLDEKGGKAEHNEWMDDERSLKERHEKGKLSDVMQQKQRLSPQSVDSGDEGDMSSCVDEDDDDEEIDGDVTTHFDALHHKSSEGRHGRHGRHGKIRIEDEHDHSSLSGFSMSPATPSIGHHQQPSGRRVVDDLHDSSSDADVLMEGPLDDKIKETIGFWESRLSEYLSHHEGESQQNIQQRQGEQRETSDRSTESSLTEEEDKEDKEDKEEEEAVAGDADEDSLVLARILNSNSVDIERMMSFVDGVDGVDGIEDGDRDEDGDEEKANGKAIPKEIDLEMDLLLNGKEDLFEILGDRSS
eukprot:TRINITY_DN1068_c1_g2_i5.p1 TRINITY_DN1068_c1_g2~~TRINITY_DN1068_c1_g2_i5.p1  ORF type:complete len:487 (-),score=201.20 TRINITY_DN1068_c1_g2_i5:135-1481(-)